MGEGGSEPPLSRDVLEDKARVTFHVVSQRDCLLSQGQLLKHFYAYVPHTNGLSPPPTHTPACPLSQ